MPDVFDPRKRSEVMSRIRGRGNRDTELVFRSLLRGAGITGWRRHYRIPGRPDFAFPKPRVAVFLDGCFWHQCPKCSRLPKGNRAFWKTKLSANVARDRRVSATLRRSGWVVVRIWEHALRDRRAVLRRVRSALRE